MTLLCIETSTSVCSAAICKDGVPVEQYICRDGSNHAKLLPTYIEQLLHRADAEQWHIDAVALSEGPGSYTGLRIGASTAKGLCYGLNVPLIPLCTLLVLCEAAKAKEEKAGGKMLCPMIDARRMEVYTAMYGGEGQMAKGERAKAVVVENEESLCSLSDSCLDGETIYYFGDGAAKCQTVLTGPQWQFIPDIVPEAQYMGLIGERRMANGEGLTGSALAYYEPFYLKEFVAGQSHVKGLV